MTYVGSRHNPDSPLIIGPTGALSRLRPDVTYTLDMHRVVALSK